jgi:hypothetical protein
MYPTNSLKFGFISLSGVNFINVPLAALPRTDPESVKFQLSRQYLFTLLGSVHVKALSKTLMKLTPDISGFCVHLYMTKLKQA